MAEKKKKPKLEMLLDEFRSHGGDTESLVRKGQDAKFYESHILPKAREWSSPEVIGHIKRATRSLREDVMKTLRGHLEGPYKKSLSSKLKQDESLPEGHEHSFAHLGPEKSVVAAREFLNEMIFHGMGYKWGLSAKDVREKYAKGDDQIRDQFRTFIANYVGKSRDSEGRELSPEGLLNNLAEKLAKSEDVLSEFDAHNGELNKFLSVYTSNLNRYGAVASAYINAADTHARNHRGALKKASNAVAGKYGHKLKDDAEAQEMLQIYLAAHDKNYPLAEAFKQYVEPLPKKK